MTSSNSDSSSDALTASMAQASISDATSQSRVIKTSIEFDFSKITKEDIQFLRANVQTDDYHTLMTKLADEKYIDNLRIVEIMMTLATSNSDKIYVDDEGMTVLTNQIMIRQIQSGKIKLEHAAMGDVSCGFLRFRFYNRAFETASTAHDFFETGVVATKSLWKKALNGACSKFVHTASAICNHLAPGDTSVFGSDWNDVGGIDNVVHSSPVDVHRTAAKSFIRHLGGPDTKTSAETTISTSRFQQAQALHKHVRDSRDMYGAIKKFDEFMAEISPNSSVRKQLVNAIREAEIDRHNDELYKFLGIRRPVEEVHHNAVPASVEAHRFRKDISDKQGEYVSWKENKDRLVFVNPAVETLPSIMDVMALDKVDGFLFIDTEKAMTPFDNVRPDLLQIASDKYCLLLQLNKYPHYVESVRSFAQRHNFQGYDTKHILVSFAKMEIDISIADRKKLMQTMSYSKLLLAAVGRAPSKDAIVRLSDWSVDKLSFAQINYASNDVFGLADIAKKNKDARRMIGDLVRNDEVDSDCSDQTECF